MSSAGVTALSPVNNESLVSPHCFIAQTVMDWTESIWIYLSVWGTKVPLRVFESDSIESVKLRIQSCKGFVVKKQKLVCGGRELARSYSLLRDYGITDGNVLHLVLRLSDLQVINVQTSCGKEFTFHVERGKNVAFVKQKISKKTKEFIDIEEQEVVCDGQLLEDERLIDDICNRNDAVIHFLVRKTAKVRAKPVAKNLELSIEAIRLDDQRDVRFPEGNDQKPSDATEEIYEKDHEVYGDIESPKNPPLKNILLEPVIVNSKIELPLTICDMITSTFDGLVSGNFPIRSFEGTGGAYFMSDSLGKKVSVFKPIDEEPMAKNNPRGLPLSLDGEGLKKGTRVGEGAFREVAAYLLDHPISGRRTLFGDEKGFSGVPPTVLVKCFHEGFNHPGDCSTKLGSLQMFMENEGSCEDIGAGSFPIEEVHKISVLDIRLANADRHAGNILLGKGEENGHISLIPIDHGYCLPSTFEDCTFDWLYWPQSRQPYTPETIEYIKLLDAEEDIRLLKFHGWDLPVECARTLRISTMLLKKGVERGLTAYDIGSIMCRKTLSKESMIEEIVRESHFSALPCTSEATFLETVSQVMDRYLEDIAHSRSYRKD